MEEIKYAVMSVRLTEEERRKFKAAAAQEGTTASQLMRKFIQEYLKEK
jgi:predicted DNA-binding protein